jgi:hypothetical protein
LVGSTIPTDRLAAGAVVAAGAAGAVVAAGAAGAAVGVGAAQADNTIEASINTANTFLMFLDIEFLLLRRIENVDFHTGTCTPPDWESQLPAIVYCLSLEYARLLLIKSIILNRLLEFLHVRQIVLFFGFLFF